MTYLNTFLIRSLWISEERELVHEIAGLGELREPWHSCQMNWLQNHLNLINNYNTALDNLDNYRGGNEAFLYKVSELIRLELRGS